MVFWLADYFFANGTPIQVDQRLYAWFLSSLMFNIEVFGSFVTQNNKRNSNIASMGELNE